MSVVPTLLLVTGSSRTALASSPPPVVNEDEQAYFELHLSPVSAAALWRIRLGDLLPEKPQGFDLGGIVRWERGPWFDSCRGQVQVSLERNADVDAGPLGSEGWEVVLCEPVMVRPSKITEDQWEAMRGDLEAVAIDLASDLIGRATAGLARVTGPRTPIDEMVAARRLLRRLDYALQRINEQPHTVLRASAEKSVRKPRRLDGATIRKLLSRGLDPRRRPTSSAARIVEQRPRASVDVPEHREMLAALCAVTKRLRDGERRAAAEIVELETDRSWREKPDDLPGTSLYDRLDRPRIQRLRAIAKETRALRREANRLSNAPVLAGLSPDYRLQRSLVFRYVPSYGLAWRAMCAWSTVGRVQIENGTQARRKDTARMYEQWIFIQIASALQKLGFSLKMENDLFRRIRRRRYLMDLPRGTHLSFGRSDEVRLELYFEPWIRPREAAKRLDDMFFHGRRHEVAWSPDVLLTFQNAPGLQVRGVVLDAKYAKRVHETHWSGVRKYFQIRRLSDGGQAVDQVWLAAPSIAGIRFEDDSISWTTSGPDLVGGMGIIQGEIGLVPNADRRAGEPVPLLIDFLNGLLAHGGIALKDEVENA